MFCRLKSCNPVLPVNFESRKFKDAKTEQVVKLEDISEDLQMIVKLQACSYAKFKLSEKLKVLSDDFPVVAKKINGQIIKNQESHHQLIKILSDASMLSHTKSRRSKFQSSSVIIIDNNPQQLAAVQAIISQVSGPAPYLVFGLLGTGKTDTLVQAI